MKWVEDHVTQEDLDYAVGELTNAESDIEGVVLGALDLGAAEDFKTILLSGDSLAGITAFAHLRQKLNQSALEIAAERLEHKLPMGYYASDIINYYTDEGE